MSARREPAQRWDEDGQPELSSAKGLAIICDVEDSSHGRPSSRATSSDTLVPEVALQPSGHVEEGGRSATKSSVSPIERFLKTGKGEPSIGTEQHATSASPIHDIPPQPLPSTSATTPISIHATHSSNSSGDSQSGSHSAASDSLNRIQATSPPTPSPISPKQGRSTRRYSSTMSYFNFKPIATPVSWSSVKVLRVRFKPSSSSDAIVNSWLIGLHSLKRGGKRSWDPRRSDENDVEDGEWPGIETSSGSPASIEVVYGGGKKYRFSPEKLTQEEIMQAILSPVC